MDESAASPLFSIIIPTLNAESVIAGCLESIARQNLDDYEVLLLDGMSRDGTRDVASDWVARLGGRLALHRDPDRGIYDAMNRGVERARGQWLYFLGADDRLHQADTLRRIADFVRANPESRFVYGDVILRSTSARHGGAFELDDLLFRGNICHQAIFYRRELFAGIGPYNLRYPIWADWDFNIRCFQNPAILPRHMDVVVADYEDRGGQSQKEDEELKQRLPVFILRSRRPRWLRVLADELRRWRPGKHF